MRCDGCGGPLETDKPYVINKCGYCWEKDSMLMETHEQDITIKEVLNGGC